jgi:hypothetical protein
VDGAAHLFGGDGQNGVLEPLRESDLSKWWTEDMGRLAENAALQLQIRPKSGGVDPSQKTYRGDLPNCQIPAPFGERAGRKG